MAASNIFISSGQAREVVGGETNNANIGSGTSAITEDYIELRVQTVEEDGTTKTGVTKLDIIKFLTVIKRWLIEGGLVGDGTNVPII